MTVRGRVDRDSHGKVDQHWRAVAELANRQHGIVSRRQLLDVGFTADGLDYRVGSGQLHRIHRGVYAVGHARITERGRWMAAVLACGHGTLLSHGPAVALHDLLASNAATIHVTVPTRGGRRRPRGLVIHRSTTLHPDDADEIDGIPVTSLARALLDYAAIAQPDQLERAIERADERHLLDLREIEAALSRGRGRSGSARLTAALAAYRPSGRLLRSQLERRFLKIVRRAGLPLPATNVWVVVGEVDAYWEEYGLVVELDSRTHHERRAAFQRDRERDRALQLNGLRTARFTDVDLRHPTDVERTVRGLLAIGGFRA